ncbi:MAG: aspartate/glutamate racemase family protein [Bordetella sp.]|uniref:aspartate/glutamate racemase family protein n=1 Tax=Bordetella sp. TaxID=28081 RepID=UPI003F7C3DB0
MSKPLTVGIAACSSEGAALCYRTVCVRAPQFLGSHAHPDVVLHSSSLAEYVDALDRNDLPGVARLMLHSAHRLAAAGADFVICPDNTIHAAFALMRDASPLPWLHIAEVVAAEAKRRGVRQAAILGTTWLMASDVYPGVLSKFDIRHLVPETSERNEIGRIIMNELVNGLHKPASVQFLQDVIVRMQERGCDAVILGCTELPIVLDDANSALPTLDSTRLLADAAIQHAISHRNIMRAATP